MVCMAADARLGRLDPRTALYANTPRSAGRWIAATLATSQAAAASLLGAECSHELRAGARDLVRRGSGSAPWLAPASATVSARPGTSMCHAVLPSRGRSHKPMAERTRDSADPAVRMRRRRVSQTQG